MLLLLLIPVPLFQDDVIELKGFQGYELLYSMCVCVYVHMYAGGKGGAFV